MELATTIHRLKLIAANTDLIPPLRFDMRWWASCAIGHATKIPEFAALGLKLRRVPSKQYGVDYGLEYQGLHDASAAVAFVGLPEKTMYAVFGPDAWYALPIASVTPAFVATHIREFITELESGIVA